MPPITFTKTDDKNASGLPIWKVQEGTAPPQMINYGWARQHGHLTICLHIGGIRVVDSQSDTIRNEADTFHLHSLSVTKAA